MTASLIHLAFFLLALAIVVVALVLIAAEVVDRIDAASVLRAIG